MSECTERVFANGERIRCYPDGRRVLVREGGSLRGKLNAALDDISAAHDELKQADRDRLRKAQESLSAGQSVPHEKRVI